MNPDIEANARLQRRPSNARRRAVGTMERQVADIYLGSDSGSLSNQELFDALVERGAFTASDIRRSEPIGRDSAPHSVAQRQVRWVQQTLKHMGLLEREGSGRARWRLTSAARERLTPAPRPAMLLGFATDLGIAVWGAAQDVFRDIGEHIDLCLTSPPFPLRKPRKYGNPPLHAYIDFVCEVLEPIVRQLRDGGSIALNVSNDIFEEGLPSRSTYRERLVIALCDRFGLHKLDELPWVNRSKPPGPLQWSSVHRMQLGTAWEPIYWFTNNPRAVTADNRRVLQPHSERHLRLVRAGGEPREASYSDGAYRIRRGSFGAQTEGRLARNVLEFGHSCADLRLARQAAKAAGLPAHGAPMPLALARFLVNWLCPPGGLVVDPCAGWMTTARAAEMAGRRWICSELFAEYVAGGAPRFGLPVPTWL